MSYRPIETDDVRYLWAAYKQGALVEMGGPFAETGMQADEFKATFVDVVTRQFDGTWTMFAPTKRGVIPVGILFALWAPLLPYMIVAGIAWFPWASRRNVVEATVKFFAGMRRDTPMVGYARDEHKALYEVCCRHGVMRRVGTSMIVSPGQPTAVYETRA